jgi:hypothetical protein
MQNISSAPQLHCGSVHQIRGMRVDQFGRNPHEFAERALECSIVDTALGHADLRSVMKYVHVRQEPQDREMELFEAKNISEAKRWSGIGPVENVENREIEGVGREGLSDRKIN